ncbi:MAG: T9SS type A sorting domain-containing protein [Rhodothermaceae bacterium]|nr:T9SS type A sorting domain-containing protein [Rhodothermaceae bacterium]
MLFVGTSKPFTGEDQFSFTTTAATTDPEEVAESLRDIYVVPNPYVATNVFEPRNPVNRAERGDRRLYFANVPQQCTIRIYTLSGELVDTIEHNGGLDEGKAFWDLRSSDNLNIAYGLYLFHVESEEGSFTGKFAIIK